MTGPSEEPDLWFSDEALRKQAALAARQPGESSLADLHGVWEPRTQPEPHERCVRCGGDGRDGAGGGESKGARWCSLCLMRGRDDYEPPAAGAGCVARPGDQFHLLCPYSCPALPAEAEPADVAGAGLSTHDGSCAVDIIDAHGRAFCSHGRRVTGPDDAEDAR